MKKIFAFIALTFLLLLVVGDRYDYYMNHKEIEQYNGKY